MHSKFRRQLTENAEREELFRTMTLEAATTYFEARGMGPWVHETTPLALAHRARLQWLEATDSMLHESYLWLLGNEHLTGTSPGTRPLSPVTRDVQRMMLGKPPLMLTKGQSR